MSKVGGLTLLSALLDVHCRREAELKGRHFLCFPLSSASLLQSLRGDISCASQREEIISKLCRLFCLSQQGEKQHSLSQKILHAEIWGLSKATHVSTPLRGYQGAWWPHPRLHGLGFGQGSPCRECGSCGICPRWSLSMGPAPQTHRQPAQGLCQPAPNH